MLSFTDTRFAGRITTERGVVDDDSPVVIVEALGEQLSLFPDEAVRLAVRLIEAAAHAEREEGSEWP